jgi:hypothetical protein
MLSACSRLTQKQEDRENAEARERFQAQQERLVRRD